MENVEKKGSLVHCWWECKLVQPSKFGSNDKDSACNSGDLGSIPGLGRFPGEGKGLPIPVFWPGEFLGLCSPWGYKELDTTEQLSLHLIL